MQRGEAAEGEADDVGATVVGVFGDEGGEEGGRCREGEGGREAGRGDPVGGQIGKEDVVGWEVGGCEQPFFVRGAAAMEEDERWSGDVSVQGDVVKLWQERRGRAGGGSGRHDWSAWVRGDGLGVKELGLQVLLA